MSVKRTRGKVAFDRLGAEAQRLVQQAVDAGALILEGEMKRSIQRGPKTGRVYKSSVSKATHRASAPGEPPASDSGNLANHITHVSDRRKLSATVGVHDITRVKYARRLEFGGVDKRGAYIAPRPYIRPAFKAKSKQISALIRRAMQQAVRRV